MTDRTLTQEQQAAVQRLYEYDETIFVAPTGFGKTVVALTAASESIRDGILNHIIVTCPAQVVENDVWFKEITKWPHLGNLFVRTLSGTEKQRLNTLAYEGTADIYVVSHHNLEWLLGQDHGCDGIVIDELSKATGKLTQCLRSKKKAGRLTWRVGMSATPVSQDFQKLYGMCRIIDGGKSLGTSKERFLADHFYSDFMGYNLTLKPNADIVLMARVRELIHAVEDRKSEELPPLVEKIIRFDMPAATRVVYDEMRRHMVAEGVDAANEAVKSGKLRQIASGFYYKSSYTYDEHPTKYLDNARRLAAREWAFSLNGRPGLIFYEFVTQESVIHAPLGFEPDMPENIQLAQIQSMSHGIEGLQHQYADVLFYQPNWSRDLTEQAIGRVWRQGQTKPVTVTTLVCNDTLDDLVLERVEDRGVWMELFMKHLRGTG